MSVLNLKRRFGRDYKIVYEESYYAQYGKKAHVEDPWLMVMLCRYGHVFPFGGTMLAASVDGRVGIAGRLKALDCCKVHQDGDGGELTALFDVKDFDRVATVMQPRRRRKCNLTPEQREAIGRRLRAGRHESAA